MKIPPCIDATATLSAVQLQRVVDVWIASGRPGAWVSPELLADPKALLEFDTATVLDLIGYEWAALLAAGLDG